MSHVRTKHKLSPGNISKLIMSLVFVFLVIGFIFSLSNIGNNKNYNLAFAEKFLKKGEAQTEPVWTLRDDGLLLSPTGHEIFVEIAKTEEERSQGLSNKEKLKVYNHGSNIVTEGMLFIFDKPQVLTFWMKDMKFDLDMIWLDENYKIVKITKDAKAESYKKEDPSSSEIFSNDVDTLAKYLLEINSGLVEKMNLKAGDILRLQ